jgi:hypothetical protein
MEVLKMKILIEAMERKTTKKDGTPMIDKYGKPSSAVVVKSGGKTYSCFGSTWNDGWKVKDTIDVEVVEKNGYLNILPPKSSEDIKKQQALEAIHVKLDKIISLLEGHNE